jgi:hypothetical protein
MRMKMGSEVMVQRMRCDIDEGAECGAEKAGF